MSAVMIDTSLDARGLRRYDKDGHRLYWHGAQPGVDYSRAGLNGGICTRGDVFDQNAALSRNARPGRLRQVTGESPLLGGAGYIRAAFMYVPGAAATVSTEIVCRGNHALEHATEVERFAAGQAESALPLPDAVDGETAERFMAKVRAFAVQHDWTATPRVECPLHRAEREYITQQLAALLAEETQTMVDHAAPGTVPGTVAVAADMGPPADALAAFAPAALPPPTVRPVPPVRRGGRCPPTPGGGCA